MFWHFAQRMPQNSVQSTKAGAPNTGMPAHGTEKRTNRKWVRRAGKNGVFVRNALPSLFDLSIIIDGRAASRLQYLPKL